MNTIKSLILAERCAGGNTFHMKGLKVNWEYERERRRRDTKPRPIGDKDEHLTKRQRRKLEKQVKKYILK